MLISILLQWPMVFTLLLYFQSTYRFNQILIQQAVYKQIMGDPKNLKLI